MKSNKIARENVIEEVGYDEGKKIIISALVVTLVSTI